MEGAFSGGGVGWPFFPLWEACDETLGDHLPGDSRKEHPSSVCDAGLAEYSAVSQTWDPPADVGSLPYNCKYLCIPKL